MKKHVPRVDVSIEITAFFWLATFKTVVEKISASIHTFPLIELLL